MTKHIITSTVAHITIPLFLCVLSASNANCITTCSLALLLELSRESQITMLRTRDDMKLFVCIEEWTIDAQIVRTFVLEICMHLRSGLFIPSSVLNEFAYSVIPTRKKAVSIKSVDAKPRHDFFSLFLESKDYDGKVFPDNFLRDNWFNVFIAGADMTPVAVSWFFWLIYKKERIYDEICQIIGKHTGLDESGQECVCAIFSPEVVRGLVMEAIGKKSRLKRKSIKSLSASVKTTVFLFLSIGNVLGDMDVTREVLAFVVVSVTVCISTQISNLIELSYTKAKRPVNYGIVLQFQTNLAIFATLFSLTGMVINKDFQAMGREANEYALGHGMYYLVIASAAVVWQLSFVGGLGVIMCMNSLLNGVLSGFLLPITDIAGVIFYHENFNGEKAMSLVLCLWGFTSYFYGEYKMSKKKKKLKDSEVKQGEVDV